MKQQQMALSLFLNTQSLLFVDMDRETGESTADDLLTVVTASPHTQRQSLFSFGFSFSISGGSFSVSGGQLKPALSQE